MESELKRIYMYLFFILIESPVKLLFKKVETIFTYSKYLEVCFPTPSLGLDVKCLFNF